MLGMIIYNDKQIQFTIIAPFSQYKQISFANRTITKKMRSIDVHLGYIHSYFLICLIVKTKTFFINAFVHKTKFIWFIMCWTFHWLLYNAKYRYYLPV